MKSTVLITTYKRAHLLKWGLTSLANKPVPPQTEFVVLNDGVEDDTEKVCHKFKNKLDIKYIFTGKNRKVPWRIPGYAINHGVKQTDSDLIFLSCAEIYHMDNSLIQMVDVLSQNPKLLTIPSQGKDDVGPFLKKLPNVTEDDYNALGLLHNIHLPFFMGMNRKDFIDIGGYDEDFVGCGWDDNDIVERMRAVGNLYHAVPCRIVHLWHQRLNFGIKKVMDDYKYNQRLYISRRSHPRRNIDKNWGQI